MDKDRGRRTRQPAEIPLQVPGAELLQRLQRDPKLREVVLDDALEEGIPCRSAQGRLDRSSSQSRSHAINVDFDIVGRKSRSLSLLGLRAIREITPLARRTNGKHGLLWVPL